MISVVHRSSDALKAYLKQEMVVAAHADFTYITGVNICKSLNTQCCMRLVSCSFNCFVLSVGSSRIKKA